QRAVRTRLGEPNRERGAKHLHRASAPTYWRTVPLRKHSLHPRCGFKTVAGERLVGIEEQELAQQVPGYGVDWDGESQRYGRRETIVECDDPTGKQQH